jgi:hypothetical protein
MGASCSRRRLEGAAGDVAATEIQQFRGPVITPPRFCREGQQEDLFRRHPGVHQRATRYTSVRVSPSPPRHDHIGPSP